MSNEKYADYYTGILKSTLSQQIEQNMSMQAIAKLNGDTIGELKKQIEELVSEKNLNSSNINNSNDDKIKSLENTILELKERVKEIDSLKINNESLQGRVNGLRAIEVEYNKIQPEFNNLKAQAAQVDKLRIEVQEKDKIIGELKEQFEQLKAPVKKKKTEDVKVVEMNSPPPKFVSGKSQTSTIEDGGSF